MQTHHTGLRLVNFEPISYGCRFIVSLFLALIFVFIGLAPCDAQETEKIPLTDEEAAWIAKHPVIRLGVDPAWPPFDFINKGGDHDGFAADVLARLEDLLGIRFERQANLTWKEALAKAESRKLDVISMAAQTPDRETYLLSSATIFTMPIVIAITLGLLVFLVLILYGLGRWQTKSDLEAVFGARRFRITILAGLSILVALVMVMNWLAIADSRERTEVKIRQQLKIVLHSSIELVDFWVNNRLSFVRQVGRDQDVVRITQKLLRVYRRGELLANAKALAEARDFFAANHGFDATGFFIIAPDRVSIGSRRDANIGTRNFIADHRPDLIERVFKGEAVFVPPIRSDVAIGTGTPLTSFFAAPIVDSAGNVIAVLTERLLPSGPLSNILKFGRIGETGETYAFNAKGKMISESRFHDQLVKIGIIRSEPDRTEIDLRDPGGNMTQGYQPTTSLTERPATLMISEASLMRGDERGKVFEQLSLNELPSNIEGYRDYRGVPVIGAWFWFDRLDVGLATEMDHAEAYAGHVTFSRYLVIISAISMFLAVGATLFTLVTGQRAHRSISQARDEAEAGNRAKTEFLANMSHELRTPLNAIIGFSEIMSGEHFGPIGNEKYKEFSIDIQTSGAHLLEIVNDVLDLSRIEAGAFELNEGMVDLNEVIETSLRIVQI
ncbi:MAG: transporter substrate-binding domain-containing protein [Rhodospirillaceae bacterium]|nr:transporter substrate-binding domain-containing protein [Rhodospirillales bacterium]MBT6987457.1 transporter substrate-binding domain-containing protein [Rhodospirillaceae bacterium]